MSMDSTRKPSISVPEGYELIWNPETSRWALREIRGYSERKKSVKPRVKVALKSIAPKIEGIVWKPVTWNGGIYANEFEVSNLGEIRERDTKNPVVKYFAPTRKANQVHLGEVTTPSVAHIVAEEFVPNPHGLPFVAHIDGDYQNDKWDNLVWTNERGI